MLYRVSSSIILCTDRTSDRHDSTRTGTRHHSSERWSCCTRDILGPWYGGIGGTISFFAGFLAAGSPLPEDCDGLPRASASLQAFRIPGGSLPVGVLAFCRLSRSWAIWRVLVWSRLTISPFSVSSVSHSYIRHRPQSEFEHKLIGHKCVE